MAEKNLHGAAAGCKAESICVTRALSLTQPWAWLVAMSFKEWETRSWKTDYRGWIAIHAAKNMPGWAKALCYENPHYKRALQLYDVHHKELPLGMVICVARLTAIRSTNDWTPPADSAEYAFGDYSADRYAWKLEDVRAVSDPLLGTRQQVRGALGIWTLPRPITEADLWRDRG